MAIVVATYKDPFAEKFKSKKTRGGASGAVIGRDFSHVRRPFRGLQLKEDTYSTLEVYKADGSPIPLLNAGAREPIDQILGIVGEGKTIKAPWEHSDDPSTMASLRRSYQQGGDTKEAVMAYQKQVRPNALGPDGNSYVPKYQTDAGIDVGESNPTTALEQEQYAYQQSDFSQFGPNAQSSTQSLAELPMTALYSGAAYSLRYSNFLLQQVREDRNEKYQIMETFGIPYIYFFGERARIYAFSGILINSADFQWRNEFWANYDSTIRGTKLVEQEARVSLTFDDVMVEGYILGASASEDANNSFMVSFQFQMFITNYQCLAPLGDPRFPRPVSISIDTTLWHEEVAALDYLTGEKAYESTDALRRYNLEKSYYKQSKGAMGWLAKTIQGGARLLDQASTWLEGVIRSYETSLAGMDVRYPVGAFPLLWEINQDPQFQKMIQGASLSGNDVSTVASAIENRLSPESKQILSSGSTLSAGLPQWFIQDTDLILDMTNRYNEKASRAIKILPTGGAFVAPSSAAQEAKAFHGLIRDSADEYISTVTVPGENQAFRDFVNEQKERFEYDKDEHLHEVVKSIIRALKNYGVQLDQPEALATQELGRQALSGVLSLAMAAGTVALTTYTEVSAGRKAPNNWLQQYGISYGESPRQENPKQPDPIDIRSYQQSLLQLQDRSVLDENPKIQMDQYRKDFVANYPSNNLPEQSITVIPPGAVQSQQTMNETTVRVRPRTIEPPNAVKLKDQKQDDEELKAMLKQWRRKNGRPS